MSTAEPGYLIAVVGPSGAGKDTLLNAVRCRLDRDSRIVFPRRIITRASTAAEIHDSMSAAEFARAKANGAFAFDWEAHGNSYGIPRSIDDDIAAGKIVVCNVSRAVIAGLRGKYRHIKIVLVTASPDTLRQRLASRGRKDDGPIEQRLARGGAFAELYADIAIDNSGTVEAAAQTLLDFIETAGTVAVRR